MGVENLMVALYNETMITTSGTFIKMKKKLRFSKYSALFSKVLRFISIKFTSSWILTQGHNQHHYVLLTSFSKKWCWEISINCLFITVGKTGILFTNIIS